MDGRYGTILVTVTPLVTYVTLVLVAVYVEPIVTLMVSPTVLVLSVTVTVAS